jgi:hypothetical protein
VEDVLRQADGLRELGVDVDRIEIARGAGIAVGQILVGRHLELGKRGPGLDLVGVGDLRSP